MTDGELDALVAEARYEHTALFLAIQEGEAADAAMALDRIAMGLADALAAYRTREQQARALPEEFRRCAKLAATYGVVAAFHACADSLEAIYAKEAAS